MLSPSSYLKGKATFIKVTEFLHNGVNLELTVSVTGSLGCLHWLVSQWFVVISLIISICYIMNLWVSFFFFFKLVWLLTIWTVLHKVWEESFATCCNPLKILNSNYLTPSSRNGLCTPWLLLNTHSRSPLRQKHCSTNKQVLCCSS